MRAKTGTTTMVGLWALTLCAGTAWANDVPSSTMYFHGELTDEGGDVYTGTIGMTAGTYYMPGGPGEGTWDQGGFDVYAKQGGMAYVSCYTPTTNPIGADHDAYNETGAWGAWYDPDCADYYNFSLVLEANHWHLRHIGGGSQENPTGGTPMGGTMNWTTMYATETDLGTHPNPGNPGDALAHGGGPGAWDCDWNWGSEVIPLEMPGFQVSVTLISGNEYDVVLTPKANTIPSSTMHFDGTLTDQGGGVYTGTVPMTVGEYYVAGGDGAHIYTGGGFDVYAEEGACAFVQGFYGTGAWNCDGPDSAIVGPDHDAYSESGPWGGWWDPDCADWNVYHLELTADHWYLRYTPTDETPMSGTMNWATMYAAETDLGSQDGSEPGGSAAHGGGAQAWDWDCGWGVEVVPLELPGFSVTITPAKGDYHVTFGPASPDNHLFLEVASGSDCVTTAEQVTVTLEVEDLTDAINGVQALIEFDHTKLGFDSITAAGDWDYVAARPTVPPVDGHLDIFALMWSPITGTDADGTVATLVFNTLAEGTSNVAFRADGAVYMTKLTRASDSAVIWPNKTDSDNIAVDDTAPQITDIRITPDPTTVATVNIEVDITETTPGDPPTVMVTPQGGAAGAATFVNQSPLGTYNYTYDVTSGTLNGTASVDVSAADCAGNPNSDSDTFCIDTVDPTISASNFSPFCAKDAAVVTFDVVVGDASPSCGMASNPDVTLTLSDSSTRIATYVSGTMPGTLQYSYTVATGDPDGYVDVDATVSDAATNTGNATTVTNAIIIDKVAPTLAIQNFSASYAKEGATVTFDVVVGDTSPSSGVPSDPTVIVTLADGTTQRAATHVSGSGIGTHQYSFTVLAADYNGPVDITANVDDCAGNSAIEAVSSDPFAIDTEAPAITLGTVEQDATAVVDAATAAYRTTIADSCDVSGFSDHPVTISFTADDVDKDGYQSGLSGDPTVAAVDSGTNTITGSLGGAYVYTLTLDATTANGTASYTVNVSDLAGNAATEQGGTFPVNITQIVATVDLQGVAYEVDRAVEYVITDCSDSSTQTWTEILCTNTSGEGTTTLIRVDYSKTWSCITATEGHTLRRLLDSLTFTAESAPAAFTGTDLLTAGDFHTTVVAQDNLVDIVDFSILAANWETPVDPDESMYGDADGSGMHNSNDFAIIQPNFFVIGDAENGCTKLGLPGGGITLVDAVVAKSRVSVSELGLTVVNAHRADINGDGVIDTKDIRAFAERHGLYMQPEFEAKLSRIEATEVENRAAPSRRR